MYGPYQPYHHIGGLLLWFMLLSIVSVALIIIGRYTVLKFWRDQYAWAMFPVHITVALATIYATFEVIGGWIGFFDIIIGRTQ